MGVGKEIGKQPEEGSLARGRCNQVGGPLTSEAKREPLLPHFVPAFAATTNERRA
jgi:hypothetical protein